MKSSYVSYKAVIKTLVFTIIVMLILLYAPSPFVVMKPGIAVPVENYVTLSQESQLDSEAEEEGELLLTAVLMTTPSIWKSLVSLIHMEEDIRLKSDVMGGTTIESFEKQIKTMMLHSHSNALQAAYHYMQIPYQWKVKEIIAEKLNKADNNERGLQDEDKIIAIGMKHTNEMIEANSIEQIIHYLKNNTNKEIQVLVNRDGEDVLIELLVQEEAQALTNEQLLSEVFGIDGVTEIKMIEPNDLKYSLDIFTDNIGGPSAGLAMALQMINELTNGDLTNGNRVAVTGTIEPNGTVGAIGGIKQKVYSVNEQGAQYFIVPKANETEAKKMARRIDSTISIIAVSSLEEAMEVLASLPSSN